MKGSLFRKRVHIAPVGFEIDRVVMPLVEMKADKVWLILKKDVKEKIEKPYLDKIYRELDREKIEYKVERSNIVDLFDALDIYRKIIEIEQTNEIFINVSTGSKIQAIAGMMSSMMFKTDDISIESYYVEPMSYTVELDEGQQMTTGCKNIYPLPNYKIDRPESKLVETLEIIERYKREGIQGRISKKDLINECKQRGLIQVKKESRNQQAAEHSQLNKKLIDPLIAWGLVKKDGKGITGRIMITNEGKNMLRFLQTNKKQ